MKNNKSDISKDGEFKISLSTEDIDKIEGEIKNIDDNSKKTPDESNMIESKKDGYAKEQKKSNVVDGIILLNTCVTCHDKFKPTNSMINETSCGACLERKQIN